MSEIGTAVAALAAGELQEAELRRHIDKGRDLIPRVVYGRKLLNPNGTKLINAEPF